LLKLSLKKTILIKKKNNQKTRQTKWLTA